MNILQRIKAAFTQVRPNMQIRFMNGTPIIYNTDTKSFLDDGYLSNSVVYSIITKCAAKFSTIPWYVYRIENENELKKYKAATANRFNPNIHLVERLKERSLDELEDHPFGKLLNNPNPNDTGSELLYQLMMYRLIVGAGTMWANRAADGRPLELYSLPSHEMQLIGDGTMYGVKGYRLLTLPTFQFDPESIMYWKISNPDFDINGSQLYGLSPIKAAIRDITGNNYGKDAQTAMYKNGGANGLLTSEEEGAMSREDMQLVQNRLDEVVNSRTQKGKTVAVHAKLRWQEIGMNSVDMNLLQGLKLSKEDIVNIFDFPINLLSDERATENNKEQALKYLVTNTIYSHLVTFRDQLNNKLKTWYPNEKLYCDFDITILPEMQGDIQKMVDYLSKAPVTYNEFRRALKYDDIDMPEMDMVFVPNNKITITEAAMAANPPLDNTIEELDAANQNDYDENNSEEDMA